MKKVSRTLDLDSIPVHRREECLHYESCLDEASALLWPSFSCYGCALYCEKKLEPHSYERASSALAWEV